MYLDGDLFKKYFTGRNKELQQKEIIQKAIFEIVGIQISNSSLKIKNDTISLHISPVQKNEILFNTESILKKLSEQGYSFRTIL